MLELDLTDKITIITGAGKGTGEVVCQEFAKAGAHIVLVSRTQADLDKVAASVRELGREALPIAADVTDKAQVDGVVKQTMDKFGRIDILINVAGGIIYMKDMDNVSVEEWNYTVNLNLTAPYICGQAVSKVMIEQKAGSIVSISSIAALGSYAMSPHYGAGKAGLNSLTESMAEAWSKHNINVNGIAPGLIGTEAMKSYGTLPPETNEDGSPVPLAMLPSDPARIAALAIFLCSDAGGHISGQTIAMGQRARMRRMG